MASLMENLIDVLGRESTEYEALLQLSQRKTPIIAGGDRIRQSGRAYQNHG